MDFFGWIEAQALDRLGGENVKTARCLRNSGCTESGIEPNRILQPPYFFEILKGRLVVEFFCSNFAKANLWAQVCGGAALISRLHGFDDKSISIATNAGVKNADIFIVASIGK